MRFDDRLATVLAQPAASPRDRAIRWRQLVDLVARSGGKGDPGLVSQAIAAIRADSAEVDESVRSATARAISGLQVPLPLLELFAGDRLTVAAPLLASADLDPDRIAALRASASPEVRPFLDSLVPPPAAALPPEPAPAEPPVQAPAEPPAQAPAEPEHVPSISEVVARIEKLRSSREQAASAVKPAAAMPVSPSVFRWECNPGGEIDWVEGAPRGPLVGRSIATADLDEGVDDCVERSFNVRAPFRDCVLELGEEGPLAGRWTISGVPAFAAGDGRFVGYRGVASREDDIGQAAAPAHSAYAPDHDSLREMIHEIKTPLNAIIGFAEIIDGQYFGPAHSRYRERAAEIVANARSLLEAAEDLDFAARLQSARSQPGEGTDLKAFLPGFFERLQERAVRQNILLQIDAGRASGRCALDPELAERLLRRFADAVLGAAAGEALTFRVEQKGERCAVSISRPQTTVMASKEDLLDPEFTLGEGDRALLGLGFSLRLVNGLVGIAGGELEIGDEQFTLSLPMIRG